MISKPLKDPIVTISVKIYQMLLVTYPTKFQQEYGSHMLQVFRDCCLRAFRQSGNSGMLKLWALTLFDLLRSSIEEHLQKETFMTRTKFIRLSGWSLILGGVSFSLTILGSFFPLDNILPTDFGLQMLVWVIPILLGVGLLGLRVRYGDEVGGFGKNILLLGAIAGPVINFTGAVIVAKVGNWSGPYTWLLPITGVAVLLACLSIFGIPALRAKPLPRWNSLPLIAGLWYPPLMILMYIDEALGIDQFSLSDLAGLVFLLQAVLLTVLGYMLQSKVPEEIPATA